MRSNDNRKKHPRGSSPSNQEGGHEFDNWGVDWMESRRLVFGDDSSVDTTTQGSGKVAHSDAREGDNTYAGGTQNKPVE
jgi:hypothetical protein